MPTLRLLTEQAKFAELMFEYPEGGVCMIMKNSESWVELGMKKKTKRKRSEEATETEIKKQQKKK